LSALLLQFKTVNLDALTAEAAKHAENKHVQYCNFTLRPLGYESFKLDGGKSALCSRFIVLPLPRS
jgi:hypothetical protein